MLTRKWGWGLTAAGLLTVAVGWLLASDAVGWFGRSFMPSPLGQEAGFVEAKPTARAFLTRSLGGVEAFDQGIWAKRNGLGSRIAFSHHLAEVFPPSLFRQHPEFFPEEKGKRIEPPANSGFWNPDLGREDVALYAADAARRYFDREPEAPSFALGVNDGLIFGESAETVARVSPPRWFRDRPDYSPLVFSFMNRAAAELVRSHPDKYLGALAYYWAENTPGFPVHPQVLPFLTADRSQGYDLAFKNQEQTLQKRWGQAGPKRLGLYDYLYGQGFLIPRFHPHLIAENLRHARRAGFTDYFAEMTPNWGLDGPMPWLVSQLLLDPEQSEDVLLDEYYVRYFKKAAVPMKHFFGRCEEQWMRQPGQSYWLKHYRNESQAALFPSSVCRELRSLLDEATREADSERVRQRVNLVAEAFGATERFVTFQESRDALNHTALSRAPDGMALAQRLGEFIKARNEFLAYTRELKKREPLALAAFIEGDYLNHDPVVNAVERLAKLASEGIAGSEIEKRVRATGDITALTTFLGLLTPKNERSSSLSLNGNLDGALRKGRVLAGLSYGVDLPNPWQSKVEPFATHRARIIPGEPNSLRIDGSKDTAVYQWLPINHYGLHVARVELRGRLSPSAVATLTLGWLDKNQRHLGVTMMRLPEGEWADWVELVQGRYAPAEAFYIGIGIRVQHQSPDDWIEARNFRLQAIAP